MGTAQHIGQPAAVTVGGARTGMAMHDNGQRPDLRNAIHLHSIVA
jgi:hypothetical protein